MTRHEFEKHLEKFKSRSLRQEYNRFVKYRNRISPLVDFRTWILEDFSRTERFLLERRLIRVRRQLEIPVEFLFVHKEIGWLKEDYERYCKNK